MCSTAVLYFQPRNLFAPCDSRRRHRLARAALATRSRRERATFEPEFPTVWRPLLPEDLAVTQHSPKRMRLKPREAVLRNADAGRRHSLEIFGNPLPGFFRFRIYPCGPLVQRRNPRGVVAGGECHVAQELVARSAGFVSGTCSAAVGRAALPSGVASQQHVGLRSSPVPRRHAHGHVDRRRAQHRRDERQRQHHRAAGQ